MIRQQPVAVVTGGEAGIGLEVCRRLAESGLQVVLTSRDEADGAVAVRSLDTDGHSVLYVQLDPDDDRSIGRATGFVDAALGRVDVLVNAYSIPPVDPGEDGDGLSVGAVRVLRTSRAFGELMRRAGYGRVVNIAGDVALPAKTGTGGDEHVAAAGVLAATDVLAAECAGDETDIKVNAVSARAGKRYHAKDADTALQLALLPPEGPTGDVYRDGKPFSR